MWCQHRDAGDTIGLQALQYGEGTPASQWAASQDGCWCQAEQGEHQGQGKCLGPSCHSHAQAERFGSCRWSQCRLGSLNEEAAREARSSHTQWLFSWLSGRVKIPAGQGLVLSHSCTEQQEGQASKGASGDMVVVGCSLSLSPSPFLSSTVKEGRGKITGARVTRHLGK